MATIQGNISLTVKGKNVVVGSSEPTNPTNGQLWLDTSTVENKLKYWNGSEWLLVNDNEETLNGIKETLNTQSLEIIATKDSIKQLISNTTIEKENGETVSIKDAYNSTVETVDGMIKTIAEHTTFNESVESKISKAEQNLEGFKQTVSETYVNHTDLASEITDLESQISQTKDDIVLSVSNTYATKENVNNITIGGTNILLNTMFDNTDNPTEKWKVGANVDFSVKYMGALSAYKNNISSTSGYVNMLSQVIYDPNDSSRQKLNKDTWYTLSFYAKGTGKIKTFVQPSLVDTSVKGFVDGVEKTLATDGNNEWTLSDSWLRHTYIFKTRKELVEEQQDLLFRLHYGNAAYICMPKLEKGNKVTDYSPAPEDIKAETKILESKINLTSGKIELIVTSNNDSSELLLTDNFIELATKELNISALTTFKSHVENGTSTVIDGGAIKTNSIDANKINVKDLRAIVAKIGGFDIDATRIYSSQTMGDGKVGYLFINNDFYSPAYGIPYNPVFGIMYDHEYQMFVRSNGQLFAKNAEIEGKITSAEGRIGGFDIGIDRIYSSKVMEDGKTGVFQINNNFYSGANGNPYNPVISVQYDGEYKFYVRSNGQLYAKDAEIVGKITTYSTDPAAYTSIEGGRVFSQGYDVSSYKNVWLRNGAIDCNRLDDSVFKNRTVITSDIIHMYDSSGINFVTLNSYDNIIRFDRTMFVYASSNENGALKLYNVNKGECSISYSNKFRSWVQGAGTGTNADTFGLWNGSTLVESITSDGRKTINGSLLVDNATGANAVLTLASGYSNECSAQFRNKYRTWTLGAGVGTQGDSFGIWNGALLVETTDSSGNKIIAGDMRTDRVLPANNTNYGSTVGLSSNRYMYGYFSTVYNSSGSITTSDKNLKKDFTEFDERYYRLASILDLQLYKYIEGTSNRFHIGAIAQEVANAMESCGISIDECGIVCIETTITKEGEKTTTYNLRYDEINTLMNWYNRKKNLELQVEINELRELVNKLASNAINEKRGL